mmetsp:Transcript_25402/g.45852  ORF Transcript_25402/g.45852 Transcript_25402/m.45852 type:complete len:479 (-) Transcript_25402:94-1530(-)
MNDTNQNPHTNSQDDEYAQNSTASSIIGLEEEQPNEDMEEPAVFVDMQDAVEVEVNDDDVPMDEDQEEAAPSDATSVQDMSKAKVESHTGPVYSVAAHNYDSTKLLILSGGGDDKSFLHQVVPGNAPSTLLLAHAHSDTVSCVAFNNRYVSDDLSKTPKLAAVGGYDGAIVLYDPDTGSKLKELEGPSDVEWLCFHPKGGSVLLAGSVSDGTIWMYHIPTSKCLQVFVGHESGVTAGSFTPDGRWALSASSDGTIRVWAPRTGVSKHVFQLGNAGLTSLEVNGGSDGQLVVVGAEDGQAHVCHVGTKKVVASLRHFEPPLSNDKDEDLELPMSVEAVGFASAAVNPNWLATGGVDGVLKIWDLANDGQCRQVCRPAEADSDAGGITRLKWHPTLPLVFTSSSDGIVRVWDARNGSLVKTLTGHADMINDLDVCFIEPENQGGTAVIVSGSDDKTIRIFEMNVSDALLEATQRAANGSS